MYYLCYTLHVMLQINVTQLETQKLIEKGNFEIYFVHH